jgi:hypothetical protein
MSRWGSQIYIHLGVIGCVRIVNWGIGRLERNVAKSIYVRDGSFMLALTMHGQNGGILFAVVDLLNFRESSLLPSVGYGLL